MKKRRYRVGFKIKNLVVYTDYWLTLNEIRVIDYLFYGVKDPKALKKITLKVVAKHLNLPYITIKKIIKNLKGKIITAYYRRGEDLKTRFYFKIKDKQFFYLFLAKDKLVLIKRKRKGGKGGRKLETRKLALNNLNV